MKENKTTWLMIFLLCGVIVFGSMFQGKLAFTGRAITEEINTLDDGSAEKTLDWEAKGNNTIYIKIPKKVVVETATLEVQP